MTSGASEPWIDAGLLGRLRNEKEASGEVSRRVLVFQPCYLFATCVALPLCLDCLPSP